jgi:DUF917 family protein
MGADAGAVSRITGADIDALAAGAAILGCGGGGQVDLLRSALRPRRGELAVRVEPVDSALRSLVAVTFLGSTTVLGEKPPGGFELPTAVEAVERWTGERAEAVVPAQIGGMTALGTVSLADMSGLPILDADMVGRATPRLDQLSIFTRGVVRLTAAIVTTSGLSIVIDASSPAELESALRGAVAPSGGWAAFALGPLSLDRVRADLVIGSVSRAIRVGRALADQESLAAAAAALGGRIAARGRVIDVERHDDPISFVHGTAALSDPRSGAVARLEMGSEYLYLTVDGEPTASVPDVISVLDARTGGPIGADQLRSGNHVEVLVLPGAPLWRSDPAFLARADPRFYGIDADPITATTP